MATPREDYIAYMEDLAKRNVDIGHDPAQGAVRFYLELNYEILLGDTEPDNKGWNLVLMGYETKMDDNKHGRQVEKVSCIFDVLKFCRADDPAALQVVYNQARDIGEELITRMHEHSKDGCEAEVSAGIQVLHNVLRGTKQTIEVGPRWDNYFGYRFSLDVLQDNGTMRKSAAAKWIDL